MQLTQNFERTWQALIFSAALLLCPLGLQAQAAEGDCGFDRWPVKIMRDHDASQVRRAPVPATISELGRIPVPQIPYPRNNRIAPQELTVYRIRGIIQHISVENDHDWHLIVRDPVNSAATMVVEIPDPECVSDQGLKADLIEARRVLHTIPKHGLAEIDGVGFFDFIHTQRGGNRNGLELHPVLALRRIQ